MKHLPKILVALVFLALLWRGGVFSTNVYLINKTNVPLIRGPIETAVGKFTRAADQSKKGGRIKIQPGEKRKLFSIPRLLLPQTRFHEKSTNIKREGDKDIEGVIIHVSAYRESALQPTKITSYWGLRPYFKLEKKFVFKFGKLFKELHITALPKKLDR